MRSRAKGLEDRMGSQGFFSGRRVARLWQWVIWLSVLSVIAFLPDALNRWVFPKELVLAAACVLACLLSSRSRMPRWLWWSVGTGVLLLTISALLGDSPIVQLLGRWPRYEGLLTLSGYVAAVWLGARTLGGNSAQSRSGTFRHAIAVASLTLAGVSVTETFGIHLIPSNVHRPGALLGNATEQGIVGVMFFAILTVSQLRTWLAHREFNATPAKLRRTRGGPPLDVSWLELAGALGALGTVVVSASRAALAGLAVAVIAMVALEVIRSSRARRSEEDRYRRPIFGALSIAVGSTALLASAMAFFFPAIVNRTLGLEPLTTSTITDRFAIYETTLRLASDHLAFGVGPNGFIDAVPPYFSRSWYRAVGPGATLDSPHNWVLQALSAGGLPLALLAIGLAVTTGIVGFTRWQSSISFTKSDLGEVHFAGSGIALLAYGIALLTHFTSPGTTLLASFLLGSLLAIERPTSAQTDVVWLLTQFGRVLRVGLISVWAIVLALIVIGDVALAAGVRSGSTGDLAAAKESFSTAQALRPWDADGVSIAAQVMAHAADQRQPGAAELAVLYGERALALTPGSLPLLKAVAVGQQFTGDLPGALRSMSRAAELAPYDGEVAFRLGTVHMLSGEYELAEGELLRATELDPKDPAPWQTLAYLYEQAGRTQAADSANNRAAELSLAPRAP